MPETAPAPETETSDSVKWVPIDRIIEYAPIQVRDTDPETVKDYIEIITQAGSMDAITGWKIEGALAEAVPPPDTDKLYFLLSGGHHRLRAYRELGKAQIPMRIKTGTVSEALEDAIVSNCRHGKPLTNEDKRRCAELAVRDPQLGQKTDEWIAKRLGVSTSFVNTIRRGVTPEDKKKKAEAKKKREEEKPVEGRRETESPAPPSATARQRPDRTEEKRPTAKACLHQISEWVNTDVVDEKAVVEIFSSSTGKYHWASKEKKQQTLLVTDRKGLVLLEIPVTIQEINEQAITVSASMRDVAKAWTTDEGE